MNAAFRPWCTRDPSAEKAEARGDRSARASLSRRADWSGAAAAPPHHGETAGEEGERSRCARRIDLRCRMRRRSDVWRQLFGDVVVPALEGAGAVLLALAAIPADLEVTLIIFRGRCGKV